MKRIFVVFATAVIGLIALFTLVQADFTATITVTSAADSGAGTLRQALLDAGNGDTIVFDTDVFPPANPATIHITPTVLPPLSGGITIDGSAAGVVLDGSALMGGSGLYIATANNAVQGLEITGFPEHGILMEDGAQDNLIGGSNATPGGECSGECNLIHSNGFQGIWLDGENTFGNIISGNYFGVNRAADTCLPNAPDNAGEAVAIRYGAQHNRIGGAAPAERNITGCGGISIGNPDSDDSFYNKIINNYIGVNADDTAVFEGDFYQGVLLWGDGSYTQILSNTIRGMMGQGIWVNGIWSGEADNVLIQGNTISGNGRDGGSWGINQGIRIDEANRVTLRQNAIYNNNGPAIDLSGGVNEDIVAPIVADYDAGAGTAVGTACANCLVELYSDNGDEGQWYEGQTYANTNGDWSFANGASFQAANVHATATNADGNSSSFGVSLYVDSAGTDTPDCSNPTVPCASAAFALVQASRDDTILVAQGTYTENINIDERITLMGGYEANNWQYDPAQYETILDGSNSYTFIGDWDGNNIRYPMVITDGVELKMWYNSGAEGGSIGLATSVDGIGWTRHGQNPVLESDPESWDNRLEAPYIIKENDTSYRMWYSGFSDDGSCSIGLATSSNGLDWSKHPNNPILPPGDEPWNNVCVVTPSLLFEDGIYKMWVMTLGDDGNGQTPYIVYITSINGIDWDWANAEVVLTLEGEDWMWRPYVLHHSGDYQMWFSTWQDNAARISYATSPDETSWVRHPNSPVLNGTDGEWDADYAADPFVMYDGSVYSLWYDNEEEIGLATSTNGITWTKHISNPVFERGTPSVWGDPVINVMYNNHGLVLDGLTVTGGDGYVAGGIHTDNSNVTIQNCYIHDNQAYGDNWWGGGGVLGNGTVTIKNSIIANNHVQTNGGSGVRIGEGTLNISNTMVVGNSGDDALHLNGGGTFVNVTIADNATDVGRPGVNHNPQNGEVLTITNSIIAGNGNGAGDAIHNTDFVDVSYSYIDGGWSGVGNIDTNAHPNPGFVDAAGGDYHLAQESVCMDAGTAVYAPNHDFEGDFRPIFNGIDMGADEVSVYTADIPASSGGQITMTDNVTMTVPAGAFGEDVVIEYSPQQNADTGELVGAGVFYELTAVYASNGQPATLEPGYTYTITVPYDEANLPPEIDEADLLLFYFDGTDWQPEPTSQVNTAANLITATPNHFSLWGALEKSDYMIYLPVIIRP